MYGCPDSMAFAYLGKDPSFVEEVEWSSNEVMWQLGMLSSN